MVGISPVGREDPMRSSDGYPVGVRDGEFPLPGIPHYFVCPPGLQYLLCYNTIKYLKREYMKEVPKGEENPSQNPVQECYARNGMPPLWLKITSIAEGSW